MEKLNIINLFASNKKNQHKIIFIFFIIVFLLFTTTSCQKKSQIIIKLDGSAYENGVKEIEINNRKHQEVLNQYQDMLLQVTENSIGAADIYNNIGGIYAEYEKDIEKAEYYLEKAIRIHNEKNDEVRLAGDFVEMSKIYIYIGGDINEGFKYLEQAEKIYKKLGMDNVIGLAGAMINKGHLYKKAERYDDALEAYKKAEKIYRNRNEEEATVQAYIGQIYEKMQQYKKAEKKYIEAIKISKTKNDKYLVAEIQFELGWLYDSMENFNDAVEQYQQALQFYKNDKYYLFDTAVVYNNLSFDYTFIGEKEKALESAINSYKALMLINPVSDEIIEKIDLCKNNLRKCYENWSTDTTDEGFNKWFQNNITDF